MWYFKQDVQNNSSVLFLVSVEETVAPPGFCNGGSEVWVYRGSRVRSPPEADTFTSFVGFGTV